MPSISTKGDLTPLRRRVLGPRRAELSARQHDLCDELDELDREAIEWSARRHALVTEIDHIHDQLWPRFERWHGRRPPRPDHPLLPALEPHADVVGGRRLRAVAITILRRHGLLSLRDLHGLIHAYGYCVYGTHPAKNLADAMGYEVEQGRADRIERGRYQAADRRPGRDVPLPAPPDPLAQW